MKEQPRSSGTCRDHKHGQRTEHLPGSRCGDVHQRVAPNVVARSTRQTTGHATLRGVMTGKFHQTFQNVTVIPVQSNVRRKD